jgi:CRISPR system Cascade subunit CasA
MNATFDLLTRDVVPVIDQGVEREVSIIEAFKASNKLNVSFSAPLEMVAVFRQLLLPIYLRAANCPRDGREWLMRFENPDVQLVLDYLGTVSDRFDLFDRSRPFAQVPGLQAANGATKPSSLLRPDLATGNNVPLFSERLESTPPPMSPAQAARALLATQCWDTAAIKTGAVDDPQMRQGKTTGNPTGPLGALGVVIPWGRNLWETLILNTPIVPAGLRPTDIPQWERPPQSSAWTTRHAVGLLDLLTWQSRRIRLVPTEVDGDVVVTEVIVCAGDRLMEPYLDLEPHTLWRSVDPKKTGVSQKPRLHQPGRAAWRGLASILAAEGGSSLLVTQLQALEDLLPETLAPEAVTVGVVYGNKIAVVEEVIIDSTPLPVQALRTDTEARLAVLTVVETAENVRVAANHLHDDLRRSNGAEPIPWDKGTRAGDILISDLDAVTRRFLRGLQRRPDLADPLVDAWMTCARSEALRVAQALEEATSPTSFLGREHRNRAYRAATAVARYRASIWKLLPKSESEGEK